MAKTRCPAIYKNLGLETFGDKKKVTDEMLKQFCKNDEWLRQHIEELRYLSPPAVRKSLKISETWDEEKSWGCMSKNGQVQFSNKITDSFVIDLTSEEGMNRWYDNVKSTTYIGQYDDDDRNIHKKRCVCLPFETVVVKDKVTGTFGTAKDNKGYNSAWYVGYDKSKNFYLRPSWIKDWRHKNIPSIARAQTFKVPTTVDEEHPNGYGGRLVQVDLQLEYNGTPTASSSPLYVQIWNTYEGYVYDTKWDRTHKKVIYDYELASSYGSASANWKKYKKVKVYERYTKKTKNHNKGDYIKDAKGNKKFHYEYPADKNGKYVIKRKRVAKPYSNGGQSLYEPLAEYVYNPSAGVTKGGQQSMTFDVPPTLEAGKSYAIVLFSPLNNWENCPRWAGWGRNCQRDALYNDGDAFISYDNGRSWKRYGKDGRKEGITVYRQGKYVPQDYRFQCHVVTQELETAREYQTGSEIYLKPIYSNPIYHVKIHPDDDDSSSNDISIEYKISTDGNTWDDFNKTNGEYTYDLDEPSRVIFLKAVLYTSDAVYTPTIDSINVELKMQYPTEMYVRTKPYTPEKFGTILGASVWGRVFAPYSLDDETKVDCKVDIIQTKQNEEYFTIVDLDLLDEKIDELKISNMGWIDTHETADSRCRYLSENPTIVEKLKEDYNIYILPHEMDNELYLLSFAPSSDKLTADVDVSTDGLDEDGNTVTGIPIYSNNIGGIKLSKEVAYPVISCILEPEDGGGDADNNIVGHGQASSYGEWYDYKFDYINNELIFKTSALNRMTAGLLTIKYNPVFIKDLTNNEVGIHYDEDTGLRSDGLILDYFKERFLIGEEEVQSKKVKLKVDAVDPIKLTYLYTSADDEPLELREDVDFSYDIDTHTLSFDIENPTTILEDGDVLEVVYVPNLDDTSICIGYNATRTSTDVECIIDDYYIEYKV